eukprot:COSAG02_NODE_3160_length_7253_cov_17.821778_1_plen_90_part_10
MEERTNLSNYHGTDRMMQTDASTGGHGALMDMPQPPDALQLARPEPHMMGRDDGMWRPEVHAGYSCELRVTPLMRRAIFELAMSLSCVRC